jgi:hypothetical protein
LRRKTAATAAPAATAPRAIRWRWSFSRCIAVGPAGLLFEKGTAAGYLPD